MWNLYSVHRKCTGAPYMLPITLIVLGFIVYSACVIIPSIWEELSAKN